MLIATDRLAYGRLSSLISKGRRAADKGAYHLQRRDLESGLPGCLALLLPPTRPINALTGSLPMPCWLAGLFPGASWLAAPCSWGPTMPGGGDGLPTQPGAPALQWSAPARP